MIRSKDKLISKESIKFTIFFRKEHILWIPKNIKIETIHKNLNFGRILVFLRSKLVRKSLENDGTLWLWPTPRKHEIMHEDYASLMLQFLKNQRNKLSIFFFGQVRPYFISLTMYVVCMTSQDQINEDWRFPKNVKYILLA